MRVRLVISVFFALLCTTVCAHVGSTENIYAMEELPAVVRATRKVVNQYVRQRNYAKALAVLDSMESKGYDKNSKEYRYIYLQRAAIYHTAGREKDWMAALETLANTPEHRARAFLSKAYYCVVSPGDEKLKEAERLLTMVNPSSPVDRYSKFSSQFHLYGRLGRMKSRLQAAIGMNEIAPDSSTEYNLCISLAALNRVSEARVWLERAARDSPNETSRLAVLSNGAWHLAIARAPEDAEVFNSRALAIDPHDPQALITKAAIVEMLIAEGKSKATLEPILEAIDEKRCTNVQIWEKYTRLARLACDKKQFEKALKYATKADTANSNHVTWNQLGYICHQLGQQENAIFWKLKLVQLDPQNSEALMPMVETYARAEEIDTAIELCTKILKLNPKSKGALRMRGALYLATDRYMEANADVERLQKVDPGKDHSIETIWGYGAKFTPNLLQYYKSASAGWGELDRIRLKKLEKQIEATEDKAELAKLLQQQANMELTMCFYEQAHKHAMLSIAMGNQNFRVHSISAAALFALNRFKEAKTERQIAVALHHAQNPSADEVGSKSQ
ncbi:MAG: hypothetical protein K2X93_29510 [Candidatus Obscuribacterales bacterium]|nr:hypothetical protein [Candidatus Obscuribacterales bacterium]